jgi:hypothetical protein
MKLFLLLSLMAFLNISYATQVDDVECDKIDNTQRSLETKVEEKSQESSKKGNSQATGM